MRFRRSTAATGCGRSGENTLPSVTGLDNYVNTTGVCLAAMRADAFKMTQARTAPDIRSDRNDTNHFLLHGHMFARHSGRVRHAIRIFEFSLRVAQAILHPAVAHQIAQIPNAHAGNFVHSQ